MKVSIVIPNWNGAEKLRRNLPKVLKVRDVFEIIVVDDFSTDESVRVLKEEFPEVKVIEQKKNHGFATTCNVGAKAAEGDLVFLLNTDAFPEVNCLEFVLPHFKDREVFSVSCNTGGSWSWAKFEKGFFWHGVMDKVDRAHQTLWASGGSGVFRKDLWGALGGFDELFNRFYEEDVDIGYRATKRGYINIWEPRAKVEHYKEPGVIAQNFTKTHVARVAQRNQLYFIWKNIHDPKMITQHRNALIKMLLTHPKYWLIFLSAMKYYPEILEERKVEKNAAKVTDREILSKFSL
jgi:GT2 family glycosyltransferase